MSYQPSTIEGMRERRSLSESGKAQTHIEQSPESTLGKRLLSKENGTYDASRENSTYKTRKMKKILDRKRQGKAKKRSTGRFRIKMVGDCTADSPELL